MTELMIGIMVLLGLAAIGIPLGFALIIVGVGGFSLIHPRGLDAAGTVLGQQTLELGLNHQFTVLPLFILMGVLITRSGIADNMYDVSSKWLGHMRGGLALSTVAACGGMAAISGSSMATAATMTKVAIPAMRRYKYNDAFSAGTVAAGGTIGILIPPSGSLIIYGLLAEVNIAQLFIAGIIPGLISILFYFVAIQVVTKIRPHWAPRADRTPIKERIYALREIWAPAVLFSMIMGGIFLVSSQQQKAVDLGPEARCSSRYLDDACL